MSMITTRFYAAHTSHVATITREVEPNQFNIDAAVANARRVLANDSGYSHAEVSTYDFYSGDESVTTISR